MKITFRLYLDLKRGAQIEQNLTGNVKNNKMGLSRYIGQKSQAKESILPLENEKGELAITDTEKAKILNEFFAWSLLAAKILVLLTSLSQ